MQSNYKKKSKILKRNIKIFFNKDFSNSLFEDAYLLLKSKCTFFFTSFWWGDVLAALFQSTIPPSILSSRIWNFRFLLSNKYLHFLEKKSSLGQQ